MDHKAFMLYCLMSTFDCCLCSCYIDLDKAFMLYCPMSTFDCCLCLCYIDLDIKGMGHNKITASETRTPTTSARTVRPEASAIPAALRFAGKSTEVTKPSILRRPGTNSLPAAKRRRHVSFADLESGKERTESLMLMNIRTRHPKTDKKLEKMLGELGSVDNFMPKIKEFFRVTPEEVRLEALPMKTTGKYAYFFTVTSSTGCSKIDNLHRLRSSNHEDHRHVKLQERRFVGMAPVETKHHHRFLRAIRPLLLPHSSLQCLSSGAHHPNHPTVSLLSKKDVDTFPLLVVPQAVRFEPLPYTKGGRYVYFFKVDTSTGCSHMENLIESKKWHELFHIESINSDDQQPFMWHALPMDSIFEATFLSQRVALRSDQRGVEDDLNHQLANKEFLGRALNDVSLTEEVIGALNQRGRSIFKKQIKPQATIV
ncbi:hypothetical protein CAEBREN_20538 [Caenorhabditis brenneri]|uniref:Uncharacterized protein n=1 Tax=Caenorhabditis brenneri TaxID=135651 RepID=G0NDN1_CAEBE|nr:hypothetical protein CAEBREN_20538 [Caenorhabditis brenneri]